MRRPRLTDLERGVLLVIAAGGAETPEALRERLDLEYIKRAVAGLFGLDLVRWGADDVAHATEAGHAEARSILEDRR